MDEQRILEEMERMLAADDPRLAARLAAFGQPGLGQVLRTRRARATLSVLVLVLIAAVAAVIYLMSSFRPGSSTGGHGHGSAPASSAAPARPGGKKAAQDAKSASAGLIGARSGQPWGPAGAVHCAATVPSGCLSATSRSWLTPARPSHRRAVG